MKYKTIKQLGKNTVLAGLIGVLAGLTGCQPAYEREHSKNVVDYKPEFLGCLADINGDGVEDRLTVKKEREGWYLISELGIDHLNFGKPKKACLIKRLGKYGNSKLNLTLEERNIFDQNLDGKNDLLFELDGEVYTVKGNGDGTFEEPYKLDLEEFKPEKIKEERPIKYLNA